MSLTFFASDRFAEHQTPPGHPERAERIEALNEVVDRWRVRGATVDAPRPATRDELARVHDAAYLRHIADTAGRAVALDPDTYTSPESHEIALLAAGAAIQAVEHAMDSGKPAVAVVRPPGHHAERNQAMGFCLYNNVAVAAAHARDRGASRVAIVDYDVHHGNGTQHMFERDPNVLYVSTHQYPYYPGTGAADEVGRDAGAGFTCNLPLAAGAIDDDYQTAFAEVIVPVLQQFKPDVLLVSAGFDAHERDPLGGVRLSTAAFGAMTAELRAVSESVCGGRLAMVTEGGYDLRALVESFDAALQALSEPGRPAAWPSDSRRSARGHDAVVAAKAALAPFWKL